MFRLAAKGTRVRRPVSFKTSSFTASKFVGLRQFSHTLLRLDEATVSSPSPSASAPLPCISDESKHTSTSSSKEGLRPNLSLVVHKIPQNITKREIREAFHKFGMVSKVLTMFEDAQSSSKTVLVRFFNFEDAIQCYESCKREPVTFKERKTSVAYFKSHHSLKFEFNGDEEELRHLLAEFKGNIRRIKFLPRDGVPSDQGYIHFDSGETANKALETIRGAQTLAGNTLNLSKGDGTRSKKIPIEPTVLYVGNLKPDVTKEDLASVLATFGKVSKLVLPVKADGSCRGFGLVKFVNKETLTTSFEACSLESSHLNQLGKGVVVVGRVYEPEWKVLWFSGLKEGEEALRDMFGKWKDDIERIHFLHRSGVRTGRGLIYFRSEESATGAVANSGMKTPGGNYLSLRFAGPWLVEKDEGRQLGLDEKPQPPSSKVDTEGENEIQ